MLNLADSHVHLNDPAFDGDRDEVITRALVAGVDTLIVPSVDTASWPVIAALCERHPSLHPAWGLHPVFLPHHVPANVQALSSLLNSNRPVAVGEIGLDFHLADLDADVQRHYFVRQLELAREHELPVIVHARKALEEVIHTLRRHHGVRGVVHSFSGSEQQARQLWEMGFHLGIGGPVTYERAQRLRRIVAAMPLEWLLLESDAPDQPDASHRGERNEPARLVEILRCVASLRGESLEHVANATRSNTRRLFGMA
ncbi:MAG: TatD family hydrolase [Rhodanobacter sp.]